MNDVFVYGNAYRSYRGLVIGADCAMLYAAKQEVGRLNKELREAYVRGEKN